jgi:hypothetical protein
MNFIQNAVSKKLQIPKYMTWGHKRTDKKASYIREAQIIKKPQNPRRQMDDIKFRTDDF